VGVCRGGKGKEEKKLRQKCGGEKGWRSRYQKLTDPRSISGRSSAPVWAGYRGELRAAPGTGGFFFGGNVRRSTLKVGSGEGENITLERKETQGLRGTLGSRKGDIGGNFYGTQTERRGSATKT